MTTSKTTFSDSLTNDEIKHRILNIYANFVTDVDPDRLCDWLVQASVITLEKSKEIRFENFTAQKRCRALLDCLFSTQHPRAFLVVLQALRYENNYLIQDIDNQQPRCGIREGLQPDTTAVSQSYCSNGIKSISTRRKSEESSQPTELRAAQQEIRNLKERVRGLETELQEYRLAKVQLPNQCKNVSRVNQLEGEPLSGNLRIENKSDPVLVQTIRTKENIINGLAILKGELFVVNGKSSEVDIYMYDSTKFIFSRRWSLMELVDPFDLGSCNINNCLYVFDYKGDNQSKEILRVDLNGKLIKKWPTGSNYGRLSVTMEQSIILAVFQKNLLNEYSPYGLLIREINLSSYASIVNPYRAIKLANGQFVVSHGSVNGDGQHGVCLVDEGGRFKKIFGGKCGSTVVQMKEPVGLFVCGNGSVLVADRDNRRVILLDSDLEFKREILSGEKHGLRHPRRILLDESNRRLFVADNRWDSNNMTYTDEQISIFDI